MTAFETETCGRCGGSGAYSFNLMHGTTCYGCSGTGRKLTKRGAAASAYFTSLITKPVSALQVGDQIHEALGLGRRVWCKITAIGPDMGAKYQGEEYGDRTLITFTRKGKTSGFGGLRPDSPVRSVRDEAERQAFIAQALAYQDTLTKAGKPRATTTKEDA